MSRFILLLYLLIAQNSFAQSTDQTFTISRVELTDGTLMIEEETSLTIASTSIT